MKFSRRSFFTNLAGIVGWAGAGFPVGWLPAIPSPTPSASVEAEDWLHNWQAALRVPVLESSDSKEELLLLAIQYCQPIDILYSGGRTPGMERRVQPLMLYRVDGYFGTYLYAFCYLRREFRTFRLNRLDIALVDP